MQGLGAYGGMTGPQSAISMGVMNQNLDSSADEIDHRLTSPLRLLASPPRLHFVPLNSDMVNVHFFCNETILYSAAIPQQFQFWFRTQEFIRL